MNFNKLVCLTLALLVVCQASDITTYRFLAQNTDLQALVKCVGSNQECLAEAMKIQQQGIDPSKFDPSKFNPTDFPCLTGCVANNQGLKDIMTAAVKTAQTQPTADQQAACAQGLISLTADMQSLSTSITPSDLQNLATDDEISPKIYAILKKHEGDICPYFKPVYQSIEAFFASGTNGTLLTLSFGLIALFALLF